MSDDLAVELVQSVIQQQAAELVALRARVDALETIEALNRDRITKLEQMLSWDAAHQEVGS